MRTDSAEERKCLTVMETDDEKSSHYYLESKDKNTADQSIYGALELFYLLIISNKFM